MGHTLASVLRKTDPTLPSVFTAGGGAPSGWWRLALTCTKKSHFPLSQWPLPCHSHEPVIYRITGNRGSKYIPVIEMERCPPVFPPSFVWDCLHDGPLIRSDLGWEKVCGNPGQGGSHGDLATERDAVFVERPGTQRHIGWSLLPKRLVLMR